MADRLIMTIEQDGKKMRLYESRGSNPEVYVDGIQGMMVTGPIAKFNFFTRDFISPEEFEEQGERRKLVCRLVMTANTFLSVADYFQKHAQELKQKMQQEQDQQRQPS